MERDAAGRHAPKGTRVITLTGVAKVGTWTEEDVTGANYWQVRSAPARPVLVAGEPVLFRFKSVDVMHAFYAPALDIGPVMVEPGHVTEVLVTPKSEGVFEYFCTTICGDPHFGMRGQIVVARDRSTAGQPPPANVGAYWEEKPPEGTTRVERGKWIFRQKGCFTCHGEEGKGGVANWNYVNGTIPALRMLARTMALREKDDAKEIIGLLERGVPLRESASKIANIKVVLAKYDSILGVVRKGNPPGKKDPNGPAPPLVMPAWGWAAVHCGGKTSRTFIDKRRYLAGFFAPAFVVPACSGSFAPPFFRSSESFAPTKSAMSCAKSSVSYCGSVEVCRVLVEASRQKGCTQSSVGQ
jgi:plastocyanin